MMRTFFNKFYFGLFLLGAGAVYAQDGRAGINTADPKTNLDVSGKTDASGNVFVTDMTGFQAPRITLADLSAKGDVYGIDQKGALIYITDITGGNTTTQRVNILNVGYYYFNGSVWIPIGGEPWYNVATNTGATANTQDIYQMGKVGIGTANPAYELDVKGEIKGERLIAFGAGGNSTNTAVGIGSLASNTTGFSNAATGYQALYSNIDGYANTAMGYQALYSNTTGTFNVATGAQALYSNISGSANIATGSQVLYNNIDGGGNTADGHQALYNNIHGNYNIATGYQTLYSNISGSDNTAIGYLALYNSNSDKNTAYGYRAGYDLTTGTSNIFLGVDAGKGITTGSNNVVIGATTSPLPANMSNNIIIADGAGNRRINVDSSGNVGINTTAPTSKLQVAGLSIYANDAAAGAAGLTAGAFYILPDGHVAVKL